MLRADNLSVRRGPCTVLADIDLHLQPGQVLDVLGPNGAGKSTLLGALSGELEAAAGSVTLDGRALGAWSGQERARRLAVLPQSSTLNFAFPVLDVVSMGRLPHASGRVRDGEIVEAALRAADAEHLRGRSYLALSGGERQRISIARALLKDAPIVLLDEATASLDVENETVVQQALSRLLAGKTVIVIAHRMRTVENADKIVVLKDGVVAEQGTPAQLKAAGGEFARMVALQKEAATWQL